MIFHAVFLQLKPEVDDVKMQEMVRTTRSLLLKIPEVLGVKSGRNVDAKSDWTFFFSVETDSREKLKVIQENPFYFKFHETVIRPNTTNEFSMAFELDPSKNLRYS